MASPTAKLTFRILLALAVVLLLFYVGRPLYWKISATIHDIRHNRQTVSGGISQIVQEAQRSVGWYHDESDSGLSEKKSASARRLLLCQQRSKVVLKVQFPEGCDKATIRNKVMFLFGNHPINLFVQCFLEQKATSILSSNNRLVPLLVMKRVLSLST